MGRREKKRKEGERKVGRREKKERRKGKRVGPRGGEKERGELGWKKGEREREGRGFEEFSLFFKPF
jgi:hypothetical protein